jgi:hypothetical protein
MGMFPVIILANESLRTDESVIDNLTLFLQKADSQPVVIGVYLPNSTIL